MKKKYEEPEMIIDRFGENDGILTNNSPVGGDRWDSIGWGEEPNFFDIPPFDDETSESIDTLVDDSIDAPILNSD